VGEKEGEREAGRESARESKGEKQKSQSGTGKYVGVVHDDVIYITAVIRT
jgi:hypothetical protein